MVLCSILLSSHISSGFVIKRVNNSGARESEKFSPYFAAFSSEQKGQMKEYERLKRQLMSFHLIDWDLVADVKAFESKSSE
jgi:hypothetical protein